jgi:hypothetical protein
VGEVDGSQNESSEHDQREFGLHSFATSRHLRCLHVKENQKRLITKFRLLNTTSMKDAMTSIPISKLNALNSRRIFHRKVTRSVGAEEGVSSQLLGA